MQEILFISCFINLLLSTNGFILFPEKPQDSPSDSILTQPYVRLPTDPKVASNPIVLIPGDGGSRIRANLTGKEYRPHYLCWRTTTEFFDLWLNLELFAPLIIDCWADNMKLIFNETTSQSENVSGVRSRIPGFGGTHAVEYLDSSKRSPGIYFAAIVEALVAWGYRRGKSVAGAPYDWRLSPHEQNPYFIKLRTLIETMYRWNDNKKVVILAHSMGNPMMNYFYHNYVDQAWKDKYIHKHIGLSGAWGGAVQIVKLFASGYNMDYFRVILPPITLRGMQRTFTSSAYLFPSHHLWGANETLAYTDVKNYTMDNLKEFFSDIDYDTGYAQYQSTRDGLILDAPGVEVHCIYGTEVNTPEQFFWAQRYFPNYQPAIKYGNGDGTVNIRSLEACKNWVGNNGGMGVHVTELNGADHMTILRDIRTISLLQTILYDDA